VFLISAFDDVSLIQFKTFLIGKITLISGNSGVGKSTIINRLIPRLNLKIGEISEYHNKGMHTTTFSEMYDLPEGGSVIDTPGIKGFGVIEMEESEVGHYFKEIFEFSKKCRFNNCTHTHEPDCAVLEAIKNHYISESRYQSYLSILEDYKAGKYR
jgi:ribosome biogenesis GTPase